MRAALLIALFACESEIPVTGGFRETIIDRSIRRAESIECVDIEGDGDLDVVAALGETDAVHLYVNRGGARFEVVSISGPGSIVAADTAAADLDGDGDLDIAAVGSSQRKFLGTSAGELVWYENPGAPDGAWSERTIARPDLADTSSKSPELPWGARRVEAGDLDADGLIDLVIGESNAVDEQNRRFGNRITWYRNEGGTFVATSTIEAGDVSALLLADVDADGFLDIVAGAATERELAWYRNAQDSLHFTKEVIAADAAPHGLAFTDVDGDGDAELAVASSSPEARVSLHLFAPPDWSRAEVASGFGGDAEAPRVAAADFDGDGSIDLAVTSSSRGDLRVYRQAGGGFEQGDVRGGYSGLTGLAAGDVDGDGRTDLVTSTADFGLKDRIAWWRNESF